MPGPIATEVIEGVREGLTSGEHSIPVRQVAPVPTVPAPGSEGSVSGPPLRTTVANMARPYSAAWWFEKGGTTGIVCFVLVLMVYWMSGSQQDSQRALIDNMQKSEMNRSEENRRMIDGVLRTQSDLTTEIRAVGRTLEKLDARMERITPFKGGAGRPFDGGVSFLGPIRETAPRPAAKDR